VAAIGAGEARLVRLGKDSLTGGPRSERERGGGRRSLPGGSHDAGSRVTGRWIRSCGSGLIGKELDFGFSFDLFS
jgi:hypothetical protein